jgi:hypothetical protein
VIGEGPFDIIGLQKALDCASEYEDTVPIGTFGKKISSAKCGSDQVGALIALKNNGLKEAVIMYDGEPSAFEGALEGARIIHQIGITAKIALLPAKLDPGEADSAIILHALKNAVTYDRISALKLKMKNPYLAG